MAFTEQQKIDIRRHCGFPVFGNGVTSSPPSFGYRYYKWYMILEYRMNNLSVDEESTVINTYLTNLTALEIAIPTASENLDTDRAAVWYHNKNEVSDRYKLYKLWSNRLIDFFGIESPSKMLNQFSIVV